MPTGLDKQTAQINTFTSAHNVCCMHWMLLLFEVPIVAGAGFAVRGAMCMLDVVLVFRCLSLDMFWYVCCVFSGSVVFALFFFVVLVCFVSLDRMCVIVSWQA